MEDGIGALGFSCHFYDGFFRRDDKQFDLSSARLEFYIVRHRKRPMMSGADHQAVALPRKPLLDRYGGMRKLFSKFSGRLFLPLADPAAVDNDIVCVLHTVDDDRTEPKPFKAHFCSSTFELHRRQW
jgi:hypothetical protein